MRSAMECSRISTVSLRYVVGGLGRRIALTDWTERSRRSVILWDLRSESCQDCLWLAQALQTVAMILFGAARHPSCMNEGLADEATRLTSVGAAIAHEIWTVASNAYEKHPCGWETDPFTGGE